MGVLFCFFVVGCFLGGGFYYYFFFFFFFFFCGVGWGGGFQFVSVVILCGVFWGVCLFVWVFLDHVS